MKVNKSYEDAPREDEIIGPHSYMQVVMARGLFENWKQPVYVGFDTKMTRNLLFDIIKKLYGINFDVIACVSDCGGGNQGLWKKLGISVNNNSIQHPITNTKIFFLADAPHLIKLVRNWFIDTGFILTDGVINKEPIISLIDATMTEISSCHKLTSHHIECERVQRQNVKLATQLFSHSTAQALTRYLPGSDRELARRTGRFFSLINSWFDIMNSYTPQTSIPTKKPYGCLLEEQNNILNEIIITISDLKVYETQRCLQVFQKGIIISTTSLMEMYCELKQRFDIKYILTHRLNHDCLENFFSQLRTRGGLNDHPSPLNILYRIRMILLGKNPGIVKKILMF